ncbi:AAA family ATPase [Sorangium sp. So ce1182]|uniref:AAA family ATPase n=1 Tax=Sorangium sp. So ce1182 TaxID=3133334 RepID=UPI003F60785E
MITKICARNFRSIGKRIELELGAMTVLVGPNASGKSNVVDLLRFLAECASGGGGIDKPVAARHGLRALRHGSSAEPSDVLLEVHVERDDGAGVWGFTLTSSDEFDSVWVKSERAVWFPGMAPDIGTRARIFELLEKSEDTWTEEERGMFLGDNARATAESDATPFPQPERFTSHKGDFFLKLPPFFRHDDSQVRQIEPQPARLYRFAPLMEELRSVAIYSLFPDVLRAPQHPDPSKPMSTKGSNWASTLRALERSTWGTELVAALGRLAVDIDEYRVTQAGGFLIPEFRHGLDAQGRERWYGAAQESDGTLRVAAVLTALFQDPAPVLLGFEEPELGVHPGAIPLLFDFLKEASTRSQVLLTTHSPDLLDLVPIDDVRVVERRDGATTVARVDERQRELVRKRLMSTSDLLHAEGLRPEEPASDG